jgi:hypothetical protein
VWTEAVPTVAGWTEVVPMVAGLREAALTEPVPTQAVLTAEERPRARACWLQIPRAAVSTEAM